MFADDTNLFISGIDVDDIFLIWAVNLTKWLSDLKQINFDTNIFLSGIIVDEFFLYELWTEQNDSLV